MRGTSRFFEVTVTRGADRPFLEFQELGNPRCDDVVAPHPALVHPHGVLELLVTVNGDRDPDAVVRNPLRDLAVRRVAFVVRLKSTRLPACRARSRAYSTVGRITRQLSSVSPPKKVT